MNPGKSTYRKYPVIKKDLRKNLIFVDILKETHWRKEQDPDQDLPKNVTDSELCKIRFQRIC